MVDIILTGYKGRKKGEKKYKPLFLGKSKKPYKTGLAHLFTFYFQSSHAWQVD